jgi:hypothetical protein
MDIVSEFGERLQLCQKRFAGNWEAASEESQTVIAIRGLKESFDLRSNGGFAPFSVRDEVK